MIEVAGIQVARSAMIAVAHRLVMSGEVDAASRVLKGLTQGDRITLEIADREAILALDDPPEELEQLRAVLLAELVGRHRQGLA